MAILENFEPKNVFHYFEEICDIPHGSGNTKQISDYLVNFAKEHDLKYVQDDMNNVVIYKPATPGYENAPTVILRDIWIWFVRNARKSNMILQRMD